MFSLIIWLLLAKKQCVHDLANKTNTCTLFFNQSETVRHLVYAHSPALGAGLHVLHSSSDWLAGLLRLVSSVGCENIGFCVALVVRNASFFPLFFTSARS